ncbi:MAG: SPASM domain-containing protein [Caldilineales bacterium]|nr:SPASM domain-containing protein [Caldilineales bacterium]
MITIPLHSRSTHADELPRQLYIEVTNHCNSLCISCPLTYDYFLPHEPKYTLSWENFRRIVDQVPQIERAVLHGIGEPLLNRDLPRFVAHLKARGAQTLFNSNAILLNQARGDALVEAGLDELRVSIDAVTPELYARLRGVDSLPRILDNLRAFIDRHGGCNRPRVSLWLVGMRENLHQLPDFVRLGADLGVPEVYLQRLVYFGDGSRPQLDTTMTAEQSLYASLEEQQAELIAKCEQLAADLGIRFQASGATTPHESVAVKGEHPWQGCMRPWVLMYITANGNALPCCIAPFAAADYQSIQLGNIFEQPLADVWNGERYQELRAAVLGESPSPWPCQYCGVKWSL